MLGGLRECRFRANERARGDAGISLIEVVLAAAILSTVLLGIVTGIMSAVRASDLHRREARAEVAMRQYVEGLEAQTYQPCPIASLPVTFPPQTIDSYQLSVTAVDAWVSNSNPVAFSAGCLIDTGAYRISVHLTDPAGKVSQTVNVVLRSSS